MEIIQSVIISKNNKYFASQKVKKVMLFLLPIIYGSECMHILSYWLNKTSK